MNEVISINECLSGFYWIFTIIITACYTGSIIAFVTLPIYPETVDTISQLRDGFYRIGTLDRGGWERWFSNSSQKETEKLLKNLEFVRTIEEGLGNVTKPYFLFPYAFIGSKSQLNYIVQTNYSDEKMLSRRSALHISDECFALFGVAFAYQLESVYRQKFDDMLLMLQQSGFIQKIKNDVRWDMIRSSSGSFLQISSGKTLKMNNQEERGLTLADTEGMFLLLGIGFLVAGGVLISEWVGGCTNKCLLFVKVKKEQKREEHRVEEERREEETRRIETEDIARLALESASSAIGITFLGNSGVIEPGIAKSPRDDSNAHEKCLEVDNVSSKDSKHSRRSSISVGELNSAMLAEMFKGPNDRPFNIIMIDGKMMNEKDAAKYANASKQDDERRHQDNHGPVKEVSKSFEFLNDETDDDDDTKPVEPPKVCSVEINLQAPSPTIQKSLEELLGEKIKD